MKENKLLRKTVAVPPHSSGVTTDRQANQQTRFHPQPHDEHAHEMKTMLTTNDIHDEFQQYYQHNSGRGGARTTTTTPTSTPARFTSAFRVNDRGEEGDGRHSPPAFLDERPTKKHHHDHYNHQRSSSDTIEKVSLMRRTYSASDFLDDRPSGGADARGVGGRPRSTSGAPPPQPPSIIMSGMTGAAAGGTASAAGGVHRMLMANAKKQQDGNHQATLEGHTMHGGPDNSHHHHHHHHGTHHHQPHPVVATIWNSPREFIHPILKIAIPIALTNLLRNASLLIVLYYVGHNASREEYAGIATGMTFTNLTAFAISAGLAAALDTLCSQSYGRKSSNNTELGLFAQTAMIANLLVYTPIAISYFFSEPVLQLILKDTLAALVAQWLRWSLFIAVPIMTTTCLTKFCQTQCEPSIGMYSSIGALLVLPLFLYIFHGYGIPGVALAMGASRWCLLFCVMFLIRRNEKLRTNFGTVNIGQAMSFPAMKTYLRLGVPSLVAYASEMWAFEIMSVLAAHLGALEVAAWSIMIQIYAVFFGPCVGLSAASCVKIGNALGSGKADLAKQTYFAATIMCSCWGVLVFVFLFFFGGYFYTALTSDAEVIELGKSLLIIAAITFAVDVLFYGLQGVYRGCKKQSTSAFIVTAAMWGIGVPTATALSLGSTLGVKGVLLGLSAGVLIATPVQLAVIHLSFDWKLYAKKASQLQVAKKSAAAGASAEVSPTSASGSNQTAHNPQQQQQDGGTLAGRRLSNIAPPLPAPPGDRDTLAPPTSVAVSATGHDDRITVVVGSAKEKEQGSGL